MSDSTTTHGQPQRFIPPRIKYPWSKDVEISMGIDGVTYAEMDDPVRAVAIGGLSKLWKITKLMRYQERMQYEHLARDQRNRCFDENGDLKGCDAADARKGVALYQYYKERAEKI